MTAYGLIRRMVSSARQGENSFTRESLIGVIKNSDLPPIGAKLTLLLWLPGVRVLWRAWLELWSLTNQMQLPACKTFIIVID